MRRKIIECDVCGKEIISWYQFKINYYKMYPNGTIDRSRETKHICWHCVEAAEDLIKERRGL